MGGSTSREDVVTRVSSLVSNVIVNITLTCDQGTTINQNITMYCNVTTDKDVHDSWKIAKEDSVGCIDYYTDLKKQYAIKNDNQRRQWVQSRIESRKPIDETLRELLVDFVEHGKQRCKSCVFTDVSQSTTISSTENCEALNSARAKITQKVADKVNQTLTDNKDLLAPLATMLGASSSSSVRDNTTSRIMACMSSDILNKARNQVSVNQTLHFSFGNGSGGTDLNGVTQESTVNSVQKFFTKNKVFDSMYTDEEWSELKNLYDNRNTIGTLGDATVKATGIVGKMMNSVMGKVMLFVLVVTALIVGGGIVLGLYAWVRGLVSKAERDKIRNAQA